MKQKQNLLSLVTVVIFTLLCIFQGSYASAATTVNPYGVLTDNPYVVKRFMHDGKWIDKVVVPGRPPALYRAQVAAIPEPNVVAGTNTLSNVPAFDWSYGCSATAAAMMFGYYDNTGYPNVYTGPTNGGVIPMTNAVWGSGECPLSATHLGIDGRTIRGHVDDYWIAYGSSAQDPFIGRWSEHTQGECTGDFMGTNQSSFYNSDGATTFYYYPDGSPLFDYIPPSPSERDGCHGMRLFFESRAYSVSSNFSQYIMGYDGNSQGFTFEDFKQEIDAGRPVMIHVEGHSMLGFGYNDTGTLVYLRDTWDYNSHQMTWGGSYEYMQHYGVTVFIPGSAPPENVTLTITKSGSGTGTVTSAPLGIDCGIDCSEVFDYGAVVTLTAQADVNYIFTGWSGGCTGTNPECTVTLTNNITVTAAFEQQLSLNEGTIGTEITINGSGFGIRKGKVLINDIPAKIAKGGWTPARITCTVKKAPIPAETAYPVTVVVNKIPSTLDDTFTVRNPVLDDLADPSGMYPAEITVTGMFFGARKGKVYLYNPLTGKKRNCKVTYWDMIPLNGESVLRFIAPKPSQSFPAGSYPLYVVNKVGMVTASSNFTIEPLP